MCFLLAQWIDVTCDYQYGSHFWTEGPEAQKEVSCPKSNNRELDKEAQLQPHCVMGVFRREAEGRKEGRLHHHLYLLAQAQQCALQPIPKQGDKR